MLTPSHAAPLERTAAAAELAGEADHAVGSGPVAGSIMQQDPATRVHCPLGDVQDPLISGLQCGEPQSATIDIWTSGTSGTVAGHLAMLQHLGSEGELRV